MAAVSPTDLLRLPNVLTLARLGLAPFVVMAITSGEGMLALLLLATAGLLDGLDGWAARRLRQKTALGAWLDPLADKVLLVGALTALYLRGLLPGWFVLTAVLRDLVIIAGVLAWVRWIGALEIAPSRISKWTTALQIAAGLTALAASLWSVPAFFVQAMVWAAWALTVASGIDYVVGWGRRAWRIRRSGRRS